MTDEQTRAEINRLYWQSEASVAEISERVGASRRALYDAIEPQDAGLACPECGTAMGFRNRTAAEAGDAECPSCGLERSAEPPARPAAKPAVKKPKTRPEPTARPDRTAGSAGPAAGARRRSAEKGMMDGAARAVPETDRVPALSGALLAGMALGALAAYLISKD